MNPELKQKLQDIQDRLLSLKEHLEVDAKGERIAELEKATTAPNFWSDQDRATRIQQEIGRLQQPIDRWQSLYKEWEDAAVLLELADEEGDSDAETEVQTSLRGLDKSLAAYELECLFSGEHDRSDALVSINAGAGGTEAQDWTEILLRMYLRWAEQRRFPTEVLDELPGDEAGIKNVTVHIKGPFAFGNLRSETGIHRLVRISPFDAGGRRHTSFASVSVFPDLDDTIDVEINEKDLRIDTYRASGAGGQHVNKTSSAVRITHLPTGLVVQCQNERSQHRNKAMAMKMLRARLYDVEKSAQDEKNQQIQGDKKEIAWGSQIRSYVLQPYRLVKDHRTGVEVGNVDAVLDGELEPFIKAFLLWQR
ncbi:MAG: peptide chain release factor 2 [Thermodesulfobacteriota bacterium]